MSLSDKRTTGELPKDRNGVNLQTPSQPGVVTARTNADGTLTVLALNAKTASVQVWAFETGTTTATPVKVSTSDSGGAVWPAGHVVRLPVIGLASIYTARGGATNADIYIVEETLE